MRSGHGFLKPSARLLRRLYLLARVGRWTTQEQKGPIHLFHPRSPKPPLDCSLDHKLCIWVTGASEVYNCPILCFFLDVLHFEMLCSCQPHERELDSSSFIACLVTMVTLYNAKIVNHRDSWNWMSQPVPSSYPPSSSSHSLDSKRKHQKRNRWQTGSGDILSLFSPLLPPHFLFWSVPFFPLESMD